MTALQASIGSLNDLIDATPDARSKPTKPIPHGDISEGEARAVVVAAASAGLVLATVSGWAVGAVAVAVLAVGYGYDLFAKGTPWSWVPFAVGIALLPVFAWLGAAGALPDAFVVLVPVAMLAGAGLAIANATADLERDSAAGTGSIAVRLGRDRAWAGHAALMTVVIVAGLSTLAVRGAGPGPLVAASAAAGLVAVAVVLARHASPARRERAWELEAIGVALLAAAWLFGWNVQA
jgi:4-hydroxybenzoate polyprenyltransferase